MMQLHIYRNEGRNHIHDRKDQLELLDAEGLMQCEQLVGKITGLRKSGIVYMQHKGHQNILVQFALCKVNKGTPWSLQYTKGLSTTCNA